MEEVRRENERPKDIPYIAYETAIARAERRYRWLFVLLGITIGLLFASNMIWLYVWQQYDTISYSQDGEGLNNINTGEQGNIYGTETQSKAEKER